MAKPSDTLVHLGYHAGFEDALRGFRKVMMAYLWCFPVLAVLCISSEAGSLLGDILLAVLAAVLAILAFLTVARYFVKIELVMDRERQQLLLRRRILGFTHLVSLAGVEELWAVTTAGEIPAAPVNYWWDYVTLLITRSGQRFRAARHGTSFVDADRATRALGHQLGVEVLPGQAEHKVVVRPGPGLPRVTTREFSIKWADMIAVIFWALMVISMPILVGILLYR